MNMARSTFYKRPHAGHRAAREKADTDLRVRIEDILAEPRIGGTIQPEIRSVHADQCLLRDLAS